jgi:hypothetical protein
MAVRGLLADMARVREPLLGMVYAARDAKRRDWLDQVGASSPAAGAEQIRRITGAGEHAFTRFLDHPTQPAEVDPDEIAVPFGHFASDKHGVDIARVHQCHDRARHIV